MSGRPIKKGTLNVSSVVRIIDSTDGTPETGVTSATAGLAFNYRREGAAAVAITALNDLALLTTAHTDGGILHIGSGYYRVDYQDAAFATGSDGVLLEGTATGMVVIGAYHPLVDYDPYDSVRLGLSAIPNASPGAANGLPVSVAGNAYDTMYAGIVTNAQGADVATDVALLVGTDGKALISADPQDLSATLDVNTKSLTAGAITAAAVGTGAIDADALAADAAAEIADAVWDEAQAGHVAAGSFGELATEIAAILDDTDLIDDATSGLAKIATDVAAILDDTDLIDDATSGLAKIATDVAEILVDTGTTLDGRIPAALVGGRMDSNVGAVSGDATAADNLEASLETMVTGTCTGDLSTTTFSDSAITEATDDHFIGRIIVWRTGVLAFQATNITDYDGTGKIFTFTAVTEAPGAGDAYVIV